MLYTLTERYLTEVLFDFVGLKSIEDRWRNCKLKIKVTVFSGASLCITGFCINVFMYGIILLYITQNSE